MRPGSWDDPTAALWCPSCQTSISVPAGEPETCPHCDGPLEPPATFTWPTKEDVDE